MIAFGPKKDGSPNSKFFESPETITLFDVVRLWLLKNCKKVGKALIHPTTNYCLHLFS